MNIGETQDWFVCTRKCPAAEAFVTNSSLSQQMLCERNRKTNWIIAACVRLLAYADEMGEIRVRSTEFNTNRTQSNRTAQQRSQPTRMGTTERVNETEIASPEQRQRVVAAHDCIFLTTFMLLFSTHTHTHTHTAGPACPRSLLGRQSSLSLRLVFVFVWCMHSTVELAALCAYAFAGKVLEGHRTNRVCGKWRNHTTCFCVWVELFLFIRQTRSMHISRSASIATQTQSHRELPTEENK